LLVQLLRVSKGYAMHRGHRGYQDDHRARGLVNSDSASGQDGRILEFIFHSVSSQLMVHGDFTKVEREKSGYFWLWVARSCSRK